MRHNSLMDELARAAINIAERHPDLRGPLRFDEAELQDIADKARRYLSRKKRPTLDELLAGHDPSANHGEMDW